MCGLRHERICFSLIQGHQTTQVSWQERLATPKEMVTAKQVVTLDTPLLPNQMEWKRKTTPVPHAQLKKAKWQPFSQTLVMGKERSQ